MRIQHRLSRNPIVVFGALLAAVTVCAYAWANGLASPSEMFQLAIMAWAG